MKKYKIITYNMNPITYQKTIDKTFYYKTKKAFLNNIKKYWSLKNKRFFKAYELINNEYILTMSL